MTSQHSTSCHFCGERIADRSEPVLLLFASQSAWPGQVGQLPGGVPSVQRLWAPVGSYLKDASFEPVAVLAHVRCIPEEARSAARELELEHADAPDWLKHMRGQEWWHKGVDELFEVARRIR